MTVRAVAPAPAVAVAAPAEAAAKPAATGGKPAPDDPKLKHACVEFEGVLLRQLLGPCTKGAAERSGYGSMITDALAGAVTDGGGIGVAEALRRALASDR